MAVSADYSIDSSANQKEELDKQKIADDKELPIDFKQDSESEIVQKRRTFVPCRPLWEV